MLCCSVLLGVVVYASRDGWLWTRHATHTPPHMTTIKPENTNVNNRILKICTFLSYIVPYNKHPDDG